MNDVMLHDYTMKKQLLLVIKRNYIALVAAPVLLQIYSPGIEKG
jgi:hypothetical protein